MEIHWTYDGCEESEQSRIERAWERTQIALEGKVAELSDVPSELRIAVQRGDLSSEWEIQAALHLPGHTLVTNSTGRTPEEAFERILSGLANRIDRLDQSPVTVPRRREGLEDIVRPLEAWHRQRRSEPFMSFLAPLLESLGSYVQRELQVRESEETLNGEQVIVRDVLDDVLVQAWERFEQRKPDLALDLWLVQLADEALDRLSGLVAPQSVDEEIQNPIPEWNEFDSDDWIEHDSYPETIELSDLLPGQSSVAAWDDLAMETKQAHLAAMLGQLPRERRQAFVLQLAHGYNTAEIADFQNRPGEAVEADVAEAMAAIRRYFTDEQAPELQERFTKLEIRERKRKRR